MLPATRLVSSYQNMVICDCISCMSITTHLLVGIVVERGHISQPAATFTVPSSISSCASTFGPASSVNGLSLVLLFFPRCSLCPSQQSAGICFNGLRLRFPCRSPQELWCYCVCRQNKQDSTPGCFN